MADHEHVTYLVIGGGLAGSSACVALREVDPVGSAMLVGREVSRPYHRPPLSKAYLRGEVKRAELVAQPVGWYARQGIRLVTGRRATLLDTDRRRCTLDDGTGIAYDELLIATGGTSARLDIPGSDLPGLFYLRTLEDAEQLHTRIDAALREGRPHPGGSGIGGGRGRVVVIGGGVLGVEAAASLRRRGMHVELIVRGARPWHGFAGETFGQLALGLLDLYGVVVHTGAAVARLAGDGRVQRVELADGRAIESDFAVAGVGMEVDRRLLQNTPIQVGRAITVDAACRTNVPHVWAAGDVAAVYDARFGKHLSSGHWDFARQTGRLAGLNMARAVTDPAAEPEAWSETIGFVTELFDVRVQVWGAARFIDRRIVRGNGKPTAPDVAEIGVDKEGRVCHVIVAGREAESAALKRLVTDRVSVLGREDALRDPASPLPPPV